MVGAGKVFAASFAAVMVDAIPGGFFVVAGFSPPASATAFSAVGLFSDAAFVFVRTTRGNGSSALVELAGGEAAVGYDGAAWEEPLDLS